MAGETLLYCMRRLLRSLQRLLTGEDIFISYPRDDGDLQAVAIAEQLEQRRFTYYYDRLGSDSGDILPERLKRHLRDAAMLVVVCTPKAAHSKAILDEIECFGTKKPRLLVGDHMGVPVPLRRKTVLQPPSAADEIARAFTYTRLMVVRRRVVLASAVGELGVSPPHP